MSVKPSGPAVPFGLISRWAPTEQSAPFLFGGTCPGWALGQQAFPMAAGASGTAHSEV